MIRNGAKQGYSPGFLGVGILFGFVGLALVLVATSKYGGGLSPDSVGYITVARNLATGEGLTGFVIQPPLYPMILALAPIVFKIDAVAGSGAINAIIYGLVIFASAALLRVYVFQSRLLFVMGVVLVVVALPLNTVATMAWSEPLFVLFVVLFLLSIEWYRQCPSVGKALFAAGFVILACFTRYIGVTLILTGGVAMLLLNPNESNIRRRIAHAALFGLVTGGAIGLWGLRNYAISGTLFGARSASKFTLGQNIGLVRDTLYGWYFHQFANSRMFYVVAGLCAGFLAGIGAQNRWRTTKAAMLTAALPLLFSTIYVAFLVLTSTTTAYDQIDDRLLSPVYIPLLVAGLAIVQGCLADGVEPAILRTVTPVVILCMLVIPITNLASQTMARLRDGAGGYNRAAWRESETIQYLAQHGLDVERQVYSNFPDALYILAGTQAVYSPEAQPYNASIAREDVTQLRGAWPESASAYLVWFDVENREFLYQVEELQSIARLTPVVRLSDGAIYEVSPLPAAKQ